MTVRTVDSSADAAALARHVLDPARSRTVVVVTGTSAGMRWFDADAIDARAAAAADVYDLAAGDIGMTFSNALPSNKSVFGGAARIYPPGTDWLRAGHQAPVFTAYDHAEARSRVDTIVARALETPRPVRPRVEEPLFTIAVPTDIVVPSPAALMGGRVNVATLERPTPATVITDLRAPAATETPAPAEEELGQARDELTAEDELARARDELTIVGMKQLQELRDLRAELDKAREALVVERSGREIAIRAVEEELTRTRDDLEVERFRREQDDHEHRAQVSALNKRLAHTPAPRPAEPKLTPRELTRLVREKLDEIEDALAAEREEMREEIGRLTGENSQLRQRLSAVAETHREHLRAARKKATVVAADGAYDPWVPELFDASEAAVRHAISHTWVQRVPVSDKASYPLPDYVVGPEFASSLAALTDKQRAKALRCVVDVLTGIGTETRKSHPLRESDGPTAGALTRDDGAVCFRVWVEANTAAARRLHYWKPTAGTPLELSRIVSHDDMKP